ncbi:UbiH/UbiF family hydroxylase [Zhengella sp. ZM62]|uniref:UbiH/UbiF family hydroxylase n=1 Tax=Zhengella sedimenti TaxID=3390035 RepID=UPI0039752243
MAQTDIVIVGAGPAGMAAALALAQAGWTVALAGPPANAGDLRTTAIMMPGIAFLRGLGVDIADADAAPLRTMRIVDATRRLIRSPTVTFRAGEIGEDAFGYNIANRRLNELLAAAVASSGTIRRHEQAVTSWMPEEDGVSVSLGDGHMLRGRLGVAADGRASPGREAAGIHVRSRPLPQVALVTTFHHERPHEDTSTELHTEHGPVTQVPLADPHRSSLVWVSAPDEAERLAGLAEDAFCMALEQRLDSMLGKISHPGPRQPWPLSATLPSAFAARRIALVGEAAHVFPPIGAQGLNLGLRDVTDLASVLEGAGDPGAPEVLARYTARRRPDILARAGAVNALNGTLLSDFLPAQIARSAGLALLRSLPPLRGFFMREGMAPGTGFGRFADDLRSLGKEVGRKMTARHQQQ